MTIIDAQQWKESIFSGRNNDAVIGLIDQLREAGTYKVFIDMHGEHAAGDMSKGPVRAYIELP